MQAIETFQHNGCTVEIFPDDSPESPRDWDNCAVFVCFHRRYDLGDSEHGYRHEDYSGWADLRAAIERDHRPAAILPLGLIDHSGISIYVGADAHWCDPGGWDSGQIGFAFIPRDVALRENPGSRKRITKKTREWAERCIRQEVETYDDFLTGQVYGYAVTGPDGENLDSCWGIYGLDYCRDEARAMCPTPPGWDEIISGPEIPAEVAL